MGRLFARVFNPRRTKASKLSPMLVGLCVEIDADDSKKSGFKCEQPVE
jgi:hypothetical protein